MVKIDSINNGVVKSTGNIIKKVSSPAEKIITEFSDISAIIDRAENLGAYISSYPTIQQKIDFYKSYILDNYFQFKTNPETGKPYEPDVFQQAAGLNLFLGNDVLVTAPTGTGKTAIAEYIMTKNLKDGFKTFYTAPLKALSNQKYREFCEVYGENNVGLLTGDVKVNTDAPIVVMTTEVYRNMTANDVFNPQSPKKSVPKDLKTVIFDELQYLGDVDRGGIWEQSIMFTPKNVQMLSLSATIGNNEYINNWLASTKGKRASAITPDEEYVLRGNARTKESVLINVPSENRHVPLHFEIIPVPADLKKAQKNSKKSKTLTKLENAELIQSIYSKPAKEAYKYLTQKLKDEDKLPAIYFIFSKRECRNILKYLSDNCDVLTTKEEREQIDKILKRYEDEGIYLGETLNIKYLKQGYAIHNSGLLPSQKQLIEELFQKKLVKVVLATETLSAGINMPARTTVITTPRKPTSNPDDGPDHKRNISDNEGHQMAGRAGRRGIDKEGFAILLSCNNAQDKFYQDLIKHSSNPLYSNMELDYSFITRYLSEFINEEELEKILSKSLYAFSSKKEEQNSRLNELMTQYRTKKDILLNNDFIDNNGTLTEKGNILCNLNGYEQIPIVNVIAGKHIQNLNPVQIAGVIGGLANIESYTQDEQNEKMVQVIYPEDMEFSDVVNKCSNIVNSYENETSLIYPDRRLVFNHNIIEHLYNWAISNRDSETNSINNWKGLYNYLTDIGNIRDEGTLFKEIAMTIDLLKQLIPACENAADFAKTEENKIYYTELKEKFEETLALIQKAPVTEELI